MAQTYPASLQECFTRGSFSRIPGNNVIYSETDFGPSKVRRRTTLRVDTIQGDILLKDNDEYNDFFTFFTSTLQDGTLSFNFQDPVTKNPIEVKFKEARFQLRDVGFETYRISMTLEIVSE